MKLAQVILGILPIICWLAPTEGARILGVFPFPAKSHYIVSSAVIAELARRGHEVTVIACHRQEEKLNNLTEIIVEPRYDFWSDISKAFNNLDIFQLTDMSIGDNMRMVNILGDQSTEYALKHPEVQKLIHSTDLEFDLLIVEQFFQEAFLMLAKKFNAPMVALTTYGFDNTLSGFMGQITPWSHSPHLYYPFTDRMTFFERLHNAYVCLYTELNKHWVHMPRQNELAQKYFAHLPGPLPSVWDLERNISVILMNNYVPLEWPRSLVMGMVPIGGVQIKPPKTLPRDIRQFLDEARNGAIYFSLGTNVDSSRMPASKVEAFIKVFAKLKERVLWKWGDENIPNLPKNVMVKKWMPQNDILAHPHVKLFISHGGLLSVQEAAYRSVPILAIPFFGDQFLHTKKAANDGYGIYLDFNNITETSVTWALQKLLYDPEYMIRMQEVSKIFRDRQSSAMETAIYWIDYTIRNKGAPHLKSSAALLPWYSLYLIDVIGFVFGVLFASLLGIYLIGKFIRRSTKSKKEKLYYKIN